MSISEQVLKEYVDFDTQDNQKTLLPLDGSFVASRETDPIAFPENPFTDYLKKKIIDQPVASKYDLSSVPGHLYKKNANGTFSKVSKRLVIGDSYPKVKTVNKIYYNNKITDKKSLEVAIAIFKLNISKNEISELILKDEVTTKLSDDLIDYELLKSLQDQLSASADYEDYYYAEGATLSSITYKKYTEQRFKKRVEMSWFTAGGEVYGSKEKFQFKSEVALELVRLKDFVAIG